MKNTTLIFLILLFSENYSLAQNFNGFVSDINNNEHIPFVNFKIGKSIQTANKYGYFSFKINKNDTIEVSCMGYEKLILQGVTSDTLQNIYLQPYNFEFDEIEIRQNKDLKSFQTISQQKIKDIPALFGEPDILKTLTFLPGVGTNNEASTGYLVRGGAPSQNMVLLDDVPVYNLNHLFGFVSIINPDAIKNATFYKSFMPNKFGGRLSSYLDIDLYEGNSENRKKEISIGLLSSKFHFSGPLSSKLNTSISLRSSYFTLFLLPTKLLFNKGKSDQYFNYWLYDANVKFKYNISNSSNLSFGYYSGSDSWSTISGVKNDYNTQNVAWANQTINLKLEKIIGSKLFLNSNLFSSNYKHQIKNTYSEDIQITGIKSNISDIGIKNNLDFFPRNNLSLNSGLDLVKHTVNPSSDINLESSINAFNEIALRSSIMIKSDNGLSLDIGFRQVFLTGGTDNFNGFEPRINLEFKPTKTNLFSVSFVRNHQFIRQLTSNTIGLPIDIWMGSPKGINPEESNQISISYQKVINKLKFGLEGYYKNYSNLLELNNGVQLFTIDKNQIANILEKDGIGKAFGIESNMEVDFDKFNLNTSYTYGKSRQKFQNINNNEWFYASSDRRHNFNILTTINLSQNIKLSTSTVIYTGLPATLPTAGIKLFRNDGFGNRVLPIYTERNNFRMPLYHRQDISISITKQTKFHNDKTWTFGVYNLFNTVNPFYLNINENVGFNKPNSFTLVKVGILPILPYLSYSFKW